ncbi:unnamed protein product [Ixodes pacificus]
MTTEGEVACCASALVQCKRCSRQYSRICVSMLARMHGEHTAFGARPARIPPSVIFWHRVSVQRDPACLWLSGFRREGRTRWGPCCSGSQR